MENQTSAGFLTLVTQPRILAGWPATLAEQLSKSVYFKSCKVILFCGFILVRHSKVARHCHI